MQLGKVFKENRLVSSPDWFSLFNPHFIHRCKKKKQTPEVTVKNVHKFFSTKTFF